MGEDIYAMAAKIEKAIACASASPLEQNLLAVVAAESLAAGKDKSQLESVCKFLQLLQTAIRAYM